MPALSLVEFWPQTGRRGGAWLKPPAEDSLVKSSRRVAELYSEALTGLRLENRVSSLRLMTGTAEAEEVVLAVNTKPVREGFEMARVEVPTGVADLTPLQRAVLVVEVVDEVLSRLAAARGWPRDDLRILRTYVLDRGLRFSWSSRPKASPNRRHQVQASYTMGDDGLGRGRVRLIDASGGVVGESPTFTAYSTIEGWKRSASSIRWQGSGAVSLAGYSDRFGLFEDRLDYTLEELSLHPSHVGAPSALPPAFLAGRPPRSVGIRPAEAPRPRVFMSGAGPTNDVNPKYLGTVMAMFEQVPDEVDRWWAASGFVELCVRYHFDEPAVHTLLRAFGTDMTVTIKRPTPDPEAEADPVGTAHRELNAVLGAVQTRLSLPTVPHWPRPSPEAIRRRSSKRAPGFPRPLGNLGGRPTVDRQRGDDMAERRTRVARSAEVARTEWLTPRMVRVTVTGADLASLPELEHTDHYVKILFGEVTRTYTIRSFDRTLGELVIDFVVHGDEGLAGPWAAQAQPGDQLSFFGPGGDYTPDPDAPEHLLVGDEAALPAIAAALDRLPGHPRVRVFLEVADAAEEQPLGATSAEVTWVHRGDRPYGEALAEAVRGSGPLDPGAQVFVHGNAGMVRDLRRYLFLDCGLPRSQVSISGYWRTGYDEDRWQSTKREFNAEVEAEEARLGARR